MQYEEQSDEYDKRSFDEPNVQFTQMDNEKLDYDAIYFKTV